MLSVGSVYQRKSDGLWVASLQVDGRRRTTYGKTEAEAKRKLADLRQKAAIQGGLPANATLKQVLDRWIEADSAKWKPLTLRDYRYFCDDIIGPALGNVRLAKLTPDRLQAFYNGLARKSTEKAAHCHRILRRGLHVATMWGYLPSNPLDRVIPPVHKPKPATLWTAEQARAFLDAARDHWLGPCFEAALHTGCRPGELLALRWPDWQGDALRIERTLQRVEGKWLEVEPKTRSGKRTLAVSPALAAALKRQKAQQAEWRLRAGARWEVSERIFTTKTGGPISGSSFDHALHRLADKAGLPRLGPHKLRHLSASLALQNGVPLPLVSKRLGHSSVAITASVYSHALTGDEQAAEALARALGG